MDVKEMYFKKPTQVKYYNYMGDFDEDTPDEQKGVQFITIIVIPIGANF